MQQLLFSNGDKYTGPLDSSGLFSGQGLYSFSSGASYQGQFLSGEFHGPGIYTSPTGTYQGEFSFGFLTGKSKILYKNHNEYNGYVTKNKRNGKGTLFLNELGLRLEGTFKEDNFEGFGRVFAGDRLRYEGEFVKGRLEGNGKEYGEDFSYEGGFKEGEKHGYGRLLYTNGDVYEGDFKGGYKEGIGVYRYSKGLYEGDFKEDQVEGKGIMTVDGVLIKGMFVKGRLEGEGVIIKEGIEGRDLIKGNFKGGEKNGKVRLEVERKGKVGVYEGEFSGDIEVKRTFVKRL